MEAEQRIAQKLRVHEAGTGEQIIIATIPSLEGHDIETYALELAREWQIGTLEKDDGVVFLVARSEHEMRIEVGDGLKEKLPYAAASLIIRLDVAPEFRNGNFAAGIEKGVNQMLKLLEATVDQPCEWEPRQEISKKGPSGWPFIVFIVLCLLIFFGGLGFALMTRILGRKIKPDNYKWLATGFQYGSGDYRRSSGGASGSW